MPFAPLRRATVMQRSQVPAPGDPWVITLSGATTDASGNYGSCAHHLMCRPSWASSRPGDDSRGVPALYRLTDRKAGVPLDQDGLFRF